MTKLPIVDFRRMETLLLSVGFERTRQKGSHVFYRHPDGRTTTLPNHKGRDLSRPLLRSILRDVDLSLDEFVELLIHH